MKKYARRKTPIANTLEFVFFDGKNKQEVVDMFPEEFHIENDELVDDIEGETIYDSCYIVKDDLFDDSRTARIMDSDIFEEMFIESIYAVDMIQIKIKTIDKENLANKIAKPVIESYNQCSINCHFLDKHYVNCILFDEDLDDFKAQVEIPGGLTTKNVFIRCQQCVDSFKGTQSVFPHLQHHKNSEEVN